MIQHIGLRCKTTSFSFYLSVCLYLFVYLVDSLFFFIQLFFSIHSHFSLLVTQHLCQCLCVSGSTFFYNQSEILMKKEIPNLDYTLPQHGCLQVVDASKTDPVLRLTGSEHSSMAVMKRFYPFQAQELEPVIHISSVIVMVP